MATTAKRKEDLRVLKTKKSLTDTLHQLLQEKRFEDITVNELCDRAGIRRATFYKHFEDKYAFLRFVVQKLRDNFDSQIYAKEKPKDISEYYEAYIKELVIFIDSKDEIFSNLVNTNIPPYLISIFIEQDYTATVERLSRDTDVAASLPVSVDTTAAMLNGGIGYILLNWINNNRSEPIDDVFAQISVLIDRLQTVS